MNCKYGGALEAIIDKYQEGQESVISDIQNALECSDYLNEDLDKEDFSDLYYSLCQYFDIEIPEELKERTGQPCSDEELAELIGEESMSKIQEGRAKDALDKMIDDVMTPEEKGEIIAASIACGEDGFDLETYKAERVKENHFDKKTYLSSNGRVLQVGASGLTFAQAYCTQSLTEYERPTYFRRKGWVEGRVMSYRELHSVSFLGQDVLSEDWIILEDRGYKTLMPYERYDAAGRHLMVLGTGLTLQAIENVYGGDKDCYLRRPLWMEGFVVRDDQVGFASWITPADTNANDWIVLQDFPPYELRKGSWEWAKTKLLHESNMKRAHWIGICVKADLIDVAQDETGKAIFTLSQSDKDAYDWQGVVKAEAGQECPQ